jgi:hypothetical protein
MTIDYQRLSMPVYNFCFTHSRLIVLKKGARKVRWNVTFELHSNFWYGFSLGADSPNAP